VIYYSKFWMKSVTDTKKLVNEGIKNQFADGDLVTGQSSKSTLAKVIQSYIKTSNDVGTCIVKPLNNLCSKIDSEGNIYRKNEGDTEVKKQMSRLVFVPVYTNTKVPVGENWQRTKRTASKKIMSKNMNRAILTGDISDVTVLDIDNKQGKGLKEWVDYCDKYGEPYTVKERTASGTYHYYFKYYSGIGSRLHVGQRGEWDILNDARCSVCAPSTINGKSYEWVNDPHEVRIIDMPESLMNYIVKNSKKKVKEEVSRCIKVVSDLIENDIVYYINEKYIVDLLDHLPSEYWNDTSKWFSVTSALKSINNKQIWDEYSKRSTKYNSIHNTLIWESLQTIVNINYIVNVVNGTIRTKKNKFKRIIPTMKYNKMDISSVPCDVKKVEVNELASGKYLQIDQYIKNNRNINTIIAESCQGSGKSTSSARSCKFLLSEDPESCLLILGSRVSLVKSLVSTFKNEGVEDISHYKEGKTKNRSVQIDSLVREYDECDYDDELDFSKYTVYIDEINSFIKHFVRSPTLSTKRLKTCYLLMKILKEAKYVICTDADISNKVMKFVFNIRDPKRSLYLINQYKNYNGIPAKHCLSENNLMETMDLAIREDLDQRGFVGVFDQKSTCEEYYSKFKKEYQERGYRFKLYTSDDGDDNDFLDFTSKNRGCYIFYSPKIVYGVDFTPNLATDVLVVSKCHTIDPQQICQQATRCRNIKTLYFYMDNKPRKVEYKSVDEVKNHYRENYRNYEQELKDLGAIHTSYGLRMEYQSNLLADLYYMCEYEDNVIKSNYEYHFMECLKSKGFEIESIGDMEEKVKFTNEEKEEIIEQKKEHIKDIIYAEKLSELPENIGRRMQILNVTIVDVKHNDYLLDIVIDQKKFDHVLNFFRLIQDDDHLDQKFADTVANEIDQNLIKSCISKIMFCHKLENILEIGTLEHDNDLIKRRAEEIIKYENNMTKVYSDMFETKKEVQPKKWLDGYKMLIKCYQNLISHDFISVNTKLNKKNGKVFRVFDSVTLSSIVDKYLDLYQYTYPYYYNVRDNIVIMFNIIKLQKGGRTKVLDTTSLSQNTEIIECKNYIGLELIQKPQTYFEHTINKYISDIRNFQSNMMMTDGKVEHMRLLMENREYSHLKSLQENVQAFIDQNYDTTLNDKDLVDKNIFVTRYNEYSRNNLTFIDLLPYIKNAGITYDRYKKKQGIRGLLVGLKSKKRK
jgi:hypothetical protein